MKPRAFPAPLRVLALLPIMAMLAGCSILGGKPRDPVTIYSPQAVAQSDPSWPQVDWQLAIAKPSATRLIDSPRIAVRPVPGELQVYRGSSWAQPPTDMIEAVVLRVLEDSGKIAGVGRVATGMRSDYRLAMDVRRFESDYRGGALPVATIEISATLLNNRDQRIVARRTFLREEAAATNDVATVTDAFGRALAAVSSEIAGWTLAQGHGDAQTHPTL
ncbi:ABC-type transport auxiliary lipoprotein family protein [Pseudoxanthomonas daejeonensis]|uniref:ABC-type transport auxiliary lipoprotein family protein n=1 Tax=Pseudoxanthomonas daejeonensis TaxID=266062 RepID=UPI001F53FC5E|nr:ABC-type transport auxiliary lipoprotein family protein [Pseudoxanthomonas daejeonensis]UNK56468.1 ABC-type transport auxiliary lipoprotein family protein [Pseudoxanthomonas daejeonensis]